MPSTTPRAFSSASWAVPSRLEPSISAHRCMSAAVAVGGLPPIAELGRRGSNCLLASPDQDRPEQQEGEPGRGPTAENRRRGPLLLSRLKCVDVDNSADLFEAYACGF